MFLFSLMDATEAGKPGETFVVAESMSEAVRRFEEEHGACDRIKFVSEDLLVFMTESDGVYPPEKGKLETENARMKEVIGSYDTYQNQQPTAERDTGWYTILHHAKVGIEYGKVTIKHDQ